MFTCISLASSYVIFGLGLTLGIKIAEDESGEVFKKTMNSVKESVIWPKEIYNRLKEKGII